MEKTNMSNFPNQHFQRKAVKEIDFVLSTLNEDVIKAEREHERLHFITADIFGQVRLVDWVTQAKLLISKLENIKHQILAIELEDDFTRDFSKK